MAERVDSGSTGADLVPLLADWPTGTHVFAVADREHVLGSAGDLNATFPIASVTKLFTTWATLIAVEEGSVSLDDAAGPPGSTLRHLLAHASGMGFDDPTPLFAPAMRRVYSNSGIEAAATHVAIATEMRFDDYLREAVLNPLGLESTVLRGSPAHGMTSNASDLIRFAREVIDPMLLAESTVHDATTVQFPSLRGVLPGFGSHDPNPWGLGFELRSAKHPHWTAPTQDPATVGHFGGSGSFLWIDRERGLIGTSLSSVVFGPWAASVWPVTNQQALERLGR